MKRLTEANPSWEGQEFWLSARDPDDEDIEDIYFRLKEYEDAEEQRRLVQLPCGIDDTVYGLSGYEIYDMIVDNIEISRDGISIYVVEDDTNVLTLEPSDFGDIVFLDLEKAKQKLKEGLE